MDELNTNVETQQTEQTVTSQPVQTEQPAHQKGKFGISLTGMILSFVAFLEGISLMIYPLMIEMETGYLKDKLGGGGGQVIVDTSMADMIMNVSKVIQYGIVTAAITLCIIGLILSIVKKVKRGIVFSIIGTIVTIVSSIISFT